MGICIKSRTHLAHRGGRVAASAFVVLAIGVVGLGAFQWNLDQQPDAGAQVVVYTATRGRFDHIAVEQGEIESSNSTDIVCKVRTKWFDGITILSVVPEGKHVKAGDKVMELDWSKIEDQRKQYDIMVLRKESEAEDARSLLEQAKISKREYVEGTFKTEESEILMTLAVAEEDLRNARQALQNAEQLEAKGMIDKLQLEADQNAVRNAEDNRDTANEKLRVLRDLTKKKMLIQFDSDIKSYEASLAALEGDLAVQVLWQKVGEQQLANCIIYAPSDGVVTYANKFSSRGGNSEFIVEPGAEVRDGQTLLSLPDPSKMQVVCKIKESRVARLRPGMPVKITVDAIADLRLTGTITKVNEYAEPIQMYSSSSTTKEYGTYIEITDPPAELRTGMTAEVQILVAHFDDSVQIPIEGLYEHGGQMYSLIQRDGETYETVEVEIGAANDEFASILSGISENDRIVLDLRDHLELMELPELAPEDTSEFREI